MDGTEKFFLLQHGLITHAQAKSAGLTRRQIGYRLKLGVWKERRRSVYRLAAARDTWEQRVMSAVLWAGPNAVASHGTAARLLGLDAFRRETAIHVTTSRRLHAPPGVTLHHRPLTGMERETCNLVPATSGTRTVFDLSQARVDAATFERAAEQAIRGKRTTLGRLAACASRNRGRGHAGVRGLDHFLLSHRQETEGELEAEFLRVLREARLPEPMAQVELSDARGQFIGRVDFYYPRCRLVIECDSFLFHSGRQEWEQDIERRNRLMERGEMVLQVTWGDVFERPAALIDRISQRLKSFYSIPGTSSVAAIE